MTGTSIDGLDLALARIVGSGLAMKAALVRHESIPLGQLQPRLRAAAEQQPMTAGEFARLALEFGELHRKAIAQLAGDQHIDLICVHGQTIFHQPPVSWQLINPAPLAEEFRCPIVFDLRQADLAAGGQGAPITPIADWILFRDPRKSRAIVNLGGFCNVTILPRSSMQEEALGSIRGFDVCACNQVLDAAARAVLQREFDEGGAMAMQGSGGAAATDDLTSTLRQQRTMRRSLGTGDESQAWIGRWAPSMAGADLLASAVAAIARCIGESLVEFDIDEVVLAGGGAKNLALKQAVSGIGEFAVRASDELGVPIESREALAMAALGVLCADRIPITLPQITGCSTPAPIAGCWCLPW
jgi:1,6-anhydro-N-acetylmuramate kinase